MSLPPVGIPLGAMRFNSDSQKLEYFNGEIWMQVHTFNPDLGGNHNQSQTASNNSNDLPGGTRGVWIGGEPLTSTMAYATLETGGATKLFGDCVHPGSGLSNTGTVGSRVRGIHAGGEPATSTMASFTFATLGNAVHNNEDLTTNRRFVTGISGNDRGIFMGGSEPTRINKIEYISISSFGNAETFGTLSEGKDCGGGGAWSNGVIGGVMGGYIQGGSNSSKIEYVTIPTLGNAVEFGGILAGRHNVASTSNSIRAIGAGGSPSTVDTIQYITMTTKGDATDFGDLTDGTTGMNACASPTRAVWGGGNISPAKTSKMEYVSFATLGNAVNFGTLSQGAVQQPGACSNNHGGLG